MPFFVNEFEILMTSMGSFFGVP